MVRAQWRVNHANAAARRRARQRIRRQAGPHQSRRQGGERRPALRFCGAGGRRRPEGPGRLRPRQGARSAGSHPQGDRRRQARRSCACRCARGARCITTCAAAMAPARSICARRRPAPASSPAVRCARCSRRSACSDVVAKSLGTSNPYNIVRATFDALKRQDSPRSVAARRNVKVSALQARRRDVDAEPAAAD